LQPSRECLYLYSMKLAVIGVTGLVGQVMLKVLEERHFPVNGLIPVASSRSIGKKVLFRGNSYTVVDHHEAISQKPLLALFSAGGETSRQWAPEYAASGITVIDNSSAWRMNRDVPLVVPEINSHILQTTDRIIANPNCSTIQLVMVLAPLHKRFGLRRVVISTYQSVSGTGMKAVRQLENERQGIRGEMAYPHPIDLNLFPHGGDFLPNGYTTEEMKLINETRKILDDTSITVSPTIVRVPVIAGHAESVNLEFNHPYSPEEVKTILSATPGVVLHDDPDQYLYPMPVSAQGKDDVFVGRIRRDESVENGLNLFIVADNLRKGAATNAIQIGEYLIRHFYPS